MIVVSSCSLWIPDVVADILVPVGAPKNLCSCFQSSSRQLFQDCSFFNFFACFSSELSRTVISLNSANVVVFLHRNGLYQQRTFQLRKLRCCRFETRSRIRQAVVEGDDFVGGRMVLCRRHKTINFYSMLILILLNGVDDLCCCAGDAWTRCTAVLKTISLYLGSLIVCGVLLSSRD